jgi:hypothetical protein
VTEQNDAAAGVADTDENDWRVTVRLPQGGQVSKAAAHLSAHQVEDEVRRKLGGKVMVGAGGGSELYLYTAAYDAAVTAQQSVADVLSAHGLSATFAIERWHPIEEEWEAADAAMPTTAAQIEKERERLDAEETSESLALGIALFEVRVQLPTHRASVALATRLQAEGYSVARRWRFLVVGANNADQAEEFAARIRREVPAGAEVSIEEVGPSRPYTVFELAAGSGL